MDVVTLLTLFLAAAAVNGRMIATHGVSGADDNSKKDEKQKE